MLPKPQPRLRVEINENLVANSGRCCDSHTFNATA
jgi:hypothetical protein